MRLIIPQSEPTAKKLQISAQNLANYLWFQEKTAFEANSGDGVKIALLRQILKAGAHDDLFLQTADEYISISAGSDV
jgi:hypothetical protein